MKIVAQYSSLILKRDILNFTIHFNFEKGHTHTQAGIYLFSEG